MVTVLVATDTVYKQMVSIPLEKKGNRDPFASRSLPAFARYVGHPKVIIQGDSEHALMTVIHDACALLTAATPRTSLVNSNPWTFWLIFSVRTCAVFFLRHELFWFCLVQVSTTQFCSLPASLMARVSDGTDVPVSLVPASSSNKGSPNGSLPDLEGTGYRARTMEEKINEIYLQLPLFIQNAARIENCVQTLQTVAAQTI